jgi:hypothetical protein
LRAANYLPLQYIAQIMREAILKKYIHLLLWSHLLKEKLSCPSQNVNQV